jgi:hypothetical protein
MFIQKIIEQRDLLFWSIDDNDNLVAGGYINGLSLGNFVFETNDEFILLRISKNLNNVSDIHSKRIEIKQGTDIFDILKEFITVTKKNIATEEFQIFQAQNRDEYILNVHKLIEEVEF